MTTQRFYALDTHEKRMVQPITRYRELSAVVTYDKVLISVDILSSLEQERIAWYKPDGTQWIRDDFLPMLEGLDVISMVPKHE